MHRRTALVLLVLFFPWEDACAKAGADSLHLNVTMPAPKDQWFARDKADHFMVSAFLTGCAYYAAQKEARLSESAGKNFAVGFSLSLGIFKEVYDGLSGKGNASFKDLGADALGTGLGYLMCTIGTK